MSTPPVPMLLKLAIAIVPLTALTVQDCRAQTTIKLSSGTTITITNSGKSTTAAPAPIRGVDFATPGQQEKSKRESDARDKEWVDRCKPELYTDKDGLTRYRYANRSCDVLLLN